MGNYPTRNMQSLKFLQPWLHQPMSFQTKSWWVLGILHSGRNWGKTGICHPQHLRKEFIECHLRHSTIRCLNLPVKNIEEQFLLCASREANILSIKLINFDDFSILERSYFPYLWSKRFCHIFGVRQTGFGSCRKNGGKTNEKCRLCFSK